jgi:hypothetical protein
VPAYIIEQKRQERTERVRRATSTILGQAMNGEAAAP